MDERSEMPRLTHVSHAHPIRHHGYCTKMRNEVSRGVSCSGFPQEAGHLAGTVYLPMVFAGPCASDCLDGHDNLAEDIVHPLIRVRIRRLSRKDALKVLLVFEAVYPPGPFQLQADVSYAYEQKMEIAPAQHYRGLVVAVVGSESFEIGILGACLVALREAGLARDLVGSGYRSRYRLDDLEIEAWSCAAAMDDGE